MECRNYRKSTKIKLNVTQLRSRFLIFFKIISNLIFRIFSSQFHRGYNTLNFCRDLTLGACFFCGKQSFTSICHEQCDCELMSLGSHNFGRGTGSFDVAAIYTSLFYDK